MVTPVQMKYKLTPHGSDIYDLLSQFIAIRNTIIQTLTYGKIAEGNIGNIGYSELQQTINSLVGLGMIGEKPMSEKESLEDFIKDLHDHFTPQQLDTVKLLASASMDRRIEMLNNGEITDDEFVYANAVDDYNRGNYRLS